METVKQLLILCTILSYLNCVTVSGDKDIFGNQSIFNKNVLCKDCANKSSDSERNCDNINNIQLDKTYNKMIDILKLWKSFPSTFIPKSNANNMCLKDSEDVYLAAKNMELWALKMYDSSAKLPSGILNGNINQYGDYDQCLSIRNPIKTKYCLTSLDISFKGLDSNNNIDNLIHSHHWIRSNLTDLGHRVPKVSTIYWGVCIPASCSAKELENSMKTSLNNFQADVIVDEHLCVFHDDSQSLNFGKFITLLIFTIIIWSVIIGTHIDVNNCTNETQMGKVNSVLTSFSLKRNINRLMDVQSEEEVIGLDGMRGLNALGLLLSHKSFSLFFNPFVNRTYMAEIFTKPWAVLGRTAIIYTDSFLLISGFLSARNILKDLKKSGRMNFKDKLINRLFRILPNLIAMILFCTYLLPDLGSGPLWGIIINEHSRLCKKNMWNNFLFIHNYMGFENMCLTHTHQLGIDMQLFVATPIAIWLLWKYKSNGAIVLFITAIASSMLRLFVSLSKQLSMIVYYGKSVNDFWDSANYSYILPTHRATIYIIGIGMAYFMTTERSKQQLSSLQIKLYWSGAVLLGLLSSLGPMEMTSLNYEFNAMRAAMYNTFIPITWGCFVSWTIWACNNGYAGWFGRFLSWRGFRIFTKIAYGVYLVQFPVFFYSVGSQRYSDYYDISKMINIPEFVFILMLSLILTLCIEMPFNNIRRILFDGIKSDINQNILDSEKDTHKHTNEIKQLNNDLSKKFM